MYLYLYLRYISKVSSPTLIISFSDDQTEGDEDLPQDRRQGRLKLHGGQLQAPLRRRREGRAEGRVVVVEVVQSAENIYSGLWKILLKCI